MNRRTVFVVIMLVLLYIAGVIYQNLLMVTTFGFTFLIAIAADIRDELIKQREKEEL